MRAPDHKTLRPWHFVSLRGKGVNALAPYLRKARLPQVAMKSSEKRATHRFARR
ncbi:hypothetical protein ACNKHK_09270 [Shigella flexneri]